MTRHGFREVFSRYGATLRNVQWSVCAWAPDGSLVVSVWSHHYRKGPGKSAEYVGSVSRWSGPGNREFRENVALAFKSRCVVRLVIAKTDDVAHVEAGRNAGILKKEFEARDDLIGEVAEYDGENYVFRFHPVPAIASK
jgi:hypothetical protein